MFYRSFATFDANGVLLRIRRRIFQRCTHNQILHSPNVRESHLAVQYIRHGSLCRPSYDVIWDSFTRDFMHNLNIWDVLQFKRRIRVKNGNRMPHESRRDALLLNRNWNVQNLAGQKTVIQKALQVPIVVYIQYTHWWWTTNAPETCTGWWRNKLRTNSASSWFSLHGCTELHSQQNIKCTKLNYEIIDHSLSQVRVKWRFRQFVRMGVVSVTVFRTLKGKKVIITRPRQENI